MSTPQNTDGWTAGDVPIYSGLVEELGDVLADARRTAELTMRESQRALDFGLIMRGAS
ncbi:hypothetical protein AB0393_29195 [Streptomyces cyaneofuscatus]|uniref:hypothetical protein n=1 Tax=Streptomyces cyaneofuscatus TaxID=66883 RepID=UPI00345090CA